MTPHELREYVERKRREKLHRQIGALNIALARFEGPQSGLKRVRFFRLLNKRRRLERELASPMLLTLWDAAVLTAGVPERGGNQGDPG